MEGYASRLTFGFEIDVLGSTIRNTTVKKLAVTDLQRILTPLFITVEIFALFFPCMFAVFFVHNNDDCLGHNLSEIITFMPVSLHKRCNPN